MTEKHSISQNDRLNYLKRLEKTNKEYLNDDGIDVIQYIQQTYQLNKYQKVSKDINQNIYIQMLQEQTKNINKWEYSIERLSENENYALQFVGFFILQSYTTDQLNRQHNRQLECMLHVFYGSTKILQKIFYIYIVDGSSSFRQFINSSQNLQDVSSSAERDEKIFSFIEEMGYDKKQSEDDCLDLKFHNNMFDQMIQKMLYLVNKQIID